MAKTIQECLDQLRYCIRNEHYEDAAGHVCDILEYLRIQIRREDSQPAFSSLEGMVDHYGNNPVKVELRRDW